MSTIRIKKTDVAYLDFLYVQGGITAAQLSEGNWDAFGNLSLYCSIKGINITRGVDENQKLGYLFSDEGIGIKGNDEVIWCTHGEAETNDEIRDYTSLSPILLKDGVRVIDWGNKYSSIIYAPAYRTIHGFNDTEIIMHTTDKPVSIQEAQDIAVSLGYKYAGLGDGGGSCHLQKGNDVLTKSTRANVSWFLIRTKHATTDGHLITYTEDRKITPNFRLSELLCKDGSMRLIYYVEDIYKLQKMRDFFNKPINIASAYRTKSYNKFIGGSPTSFHMVGKAYDIKIPGVSPAFVAYIAWKFGFKGAGIYHSNRQSFTHCDSRSYDRLFRDDIFGTTTFGALSQKIEKY